MDRKDASMEAMEGLDSFVGPGARTDIELPLERYGLIAEFLIGDQAFGSLANLSLVNRSVHAETLPVLYDTVVFHDYKQSFKHHESPADEQDFRRSLPNLALAVRLYPHQHVDSSVICAAWLHKPLRVSTVFYCIINTCASPSYMRHSPGNMPEKLPLEWILVNFVLGHGAYLEPDSIVPGDVKWRMSPPHSRTLFAPIDAVTLHRPVSTAFELLRLVGKQNRSTGGWTFEMNMSPCQMQAFFVQLPEFLACQPAILLNGVRFYVPTHQLLDESSRALLELQDSIAKEALVKLRDLLNQEPSVTEFSRRSLSERKILVNIFSTWWEPPLYNQQEADSYRWSNSLLFSPGEAPESFSVTQEHPFVAMGF
ncbi:hypothetical protein QFC19_008684 [Naganishia cerealis]|uniref:Uncharacterized protein n=1 Tax=Naganishia cerealis TaxID=610337 RepID=A0ACC2V1N5_9TREE|nr:hypothetical protein QFC19_008684 [Naganishia cerealis]